MITSETKNEILTFTIHDYEESGRTLFEKSGEAEHTTEDIQALWRGQGVALNSCTLKPMTEGLTALYMTIERGDSIQELCQESFEPVEFAVQKVLKNRYTDGMKYLTTLGLVGAILKATSEFHDVENAVIGITKKRALSALEKSEYSSDMILVIPYTHSWESLCESVIRQMFGNQNSLTAELIRQLTGFQKDPLCKVGQIKKIMPQPSMLIRHL